MKNKIISLGAIIIILLAGVSSASYNQVEKQKSEVLYAQTTNPLILQLIQQLQYLIDNYLEGYDQDSIIELQNCINILIQGVNHPLFCETLVVLSYLLAAFGMFLYNNGVSADILVIIINEPIYILGAIYYLFCDEEEPSGCPCNSNSQISKNYCSFSFFERDLSVLEYS